MTTTDQVRDALRAVVDPCSEATGSSLDIVEMGLVKSVTVTDGHVDVAIRLTTPACHMIPYFLTEIESQVEPLPGVDSVAVDTDDGLEWSPDMLSEAARDRRQSVLDGYEARYADRVDAGPEPGAGESSG